MKGISIGVDIGGSHISCAAVHLEEKRFLPDSTATHTVNNKAESNEIIAVWAQTIQKTIDYIGLDAVRGIGFAMPGPFEYHTGIARNAAANDKYEKMFGVHVAEALRAALGLTPSFPIRFINDATAFALGENWLGKSQGSRASLSITLGTGFGSAFLIDGIPAVNGDLVPTSGCLWHIPYRESIADDYFSSRGLMAAYHKQGGRGAQTVRELAEAVHTDPIARQVLLHFGHDLGTFLLPWVKKANVEVLVIGGNISQSFALFEEPLRQVFFEAGYPLQMAASELLETASIIGSAVLLDDTFFRRVEPLLPLM